MVARGSLLDRWRVYRRGLGWREAKAAYSFLAANLLFVVVFSFIPMVVALYLSFTRYSILKPPVWQGVQNYLTMLNDDIFKRSIANTLYFVLVITPVRLALGLVIAVLLNQKLRLRSFFRTVTFVPWITSGVVVSSIFLLLFAPEGGILNHILRLMGLPPSYWLTDPKTSMPSIILAALWRSVGWVVILYLAGLQGISEQYYEAAKIDGAGEWAQFWSITLPSLRPTTLLILVTTMISTFQMFDLVFVMTVGGPMNSTTVMALEIYNNAFLYLKMGYAAAQSYILFIIVAVLSFFSFRGFREDDAE